MFLNSKNLSSYLILLACLALVACLPEPGPLHGAHVQMEAGVIYGPGYSFMVMSPDGWLLDNKSGESQGLNAVLYPEQGSWKDSSVVMYIHSVPRASEMATHQFADYAARNHIKKTGDQRVYREDPILIAGSQSAEVRSFGQDRWGHFEQAAYIGEDDWFIVIVLNAKDRKLFDRNIYAFRELVTSYTFLQNRR